MASDAAKFIGQEDQKINERLVESTINVDRNHKLLLYKLGKALVRFCGTAEVKKFLVSQRVHPFVPEKEREKVLTADSEELANILSREFRWFNNSGMKEILRFISGRGCKDHEDVKALLEDISEGLHKYFQSSDRIIHYQKEPDRVYLMIDSELKKQVPYYMVGNLLEMAHELGLLKQPLNPYTLPENCFEESTLQGDRTEELVTNSTVPVVMPNIVVHGEHTIMENWPTCNWVDPGTIWYKHFHKQCSPPPIDFSSSSS